MSRLLQHILQADRAFETDTPLSSREAVGFLLVTSLVMTAAFLLQLELYLMIAVLGGLAAVLVLQSPVIWLAFAILGHAAVFWQMTEEFTAVEAAHSVMYYGGLLWWVFHRIVIARKPLRWTLGGVLFVLLVAQMVLLAPVSVGYGAKPFVLLRELAVLSTLLLFIPIGHEADTPFKQKIIGGSLVTVLFLLSLKNIWMYKTKVVEAVYQWQVGASRSSETFFLIFIAALIGAAMLISSWRMRTWLFWAAIFVAGTAATILSFYRTLWVSIFVGVFTMGVVMGKVFWKRALQYFAIAMVILAALFPVILEDYIPLDVMWTSISTRFESIGDYGQDLSVRNRQAESQAVIDDIEGNWLLGKGLAAPLTFYKLTTQETIHTSWTHNGYAWILKHYGILGSILLFGSYIAYIVLGLRMERRLRTWPGLAPHISFRWRAAIACGIAIIVANFFISITINQFLSHEGGLVFAVLYGLFEAWNHQLRQEPSAAAA